MIDQEYLKEILEYNPDTGLFYDKRSFKQIGYLSSINEYKRIKICIDGIEYLAHQLAFLYMEGIFVKEVDHEDRNSLNNIWLNLRKSTHQQNMCNQNIRSNNTSGYKGVSFRKDTNKWYSYIVQNYRKKHLGYFNSKEDAARAYNEAAIKYHKEFACLNWVTPTIKEII